MLQRWPSGSASPSFFLCIDVLASSDASCSYYLIVLAGSLDARRSTHEHIERAGDAFREKRPVAKHEKDGRTS